MRQQLTITIILAIALCIAVGIKLAYFPRLQGHTAFYFQTTFWICGTLITILSLNMLWNAFATHKNGQKDQPYAFWPNRRNTFRIIYPTHIRPTLIIDAIDKMAKRQLEFAIVDLSQEGICFIDDGSLGTMKTISGRIRFNNGKATSIAGEFIRRKGDHVSIRFIHAINWSILLEEQRHVLVHHKPLQRHLS